MGTTTPQHEEAVSVVSPTLTYSAHSETLKVSLLVLRAAVSLYPNSTGVAPARLLFTVHTTVPAITGEDAKNGGREVYTDPVVLT